MTYELLDSGDTKKLERFGDFLLIRPAQQAMWKPQNPSLWEAAHAEFQRDKPWKGLPKSWNINYKQLCLKLAPTSFGHLGLFPEHSMHWGWIDSQLNPSAQVLNLFAYSGAATLHLAQQGHHLCHVDASKGMVEWARSNAELNQLQQAPIRWIVDDVLKFIGREKRRNRRYDALILDPPTFGRGAQGQVFKIEQDLLPLLHLCSQVVKPKPDCVVLTCHTPGFTPCILSNMIKQVWPALDVECGEMELASPALSLPSGTYARGSRC